MTDQKAREVFVTDKQLFKGMGILFLVLVAFIMSPGVLMMALESPTVVEVINADTTTVERCRLEISSTDGDVIWSRELGRIDPAARTVVKRRGSELLLFVIRSHWMSGSVVRDSAFLYDGSGADSVRFELKEKKLPSPPT